MTKETGGDELAATSNATVILRLALDREGALLRGDLVDVEAVPVDHFVGWRGLTRALHRWLELRRPARAILGETDV